MAGAASFLWAVIVLLLVAWVLMLTGTVNIGVDFGLWINVLLVLAVAGAALNLFVFPFLSRTRKTTTATTASGTAAGAPATGTTAAGTTASGTAQREVVQETKDGQSLS
ncbi:MAG: hypothetical protein ACRDJN_18125 [Chloroflexota bacterium]